MFSDQLASIRERIDRAARRSGRDPASVRVLAVTKTVLPERIREAAAAGLTAFGENRIQEALGKMDVLQDLSLEWHFIGHLQKNKVKYLPGRFALVHSIDSLELAALVHKACFKRDRPQAALVQVNVSGEASKFGLPPEALIPMLKGARELTHIRLEGLMTIPPFAPDPEAVRPCFARLRELRDQARSELKMDLPHLSMGMSHDFEVAVEEGATWVRIGTALFGPRPD